MLTKYEIDFTLGAGSLTAVKYKQQQGMKLVKKEAPYMLKVLKRSGAIQNFDPEKIGTSILNAARDAGILMNDKEARLLSEDVKKQIIEQKGEDGIISSLEIRSMVGTALDNLGFSKVGDLFDRGKALDLTDIQRHLDAIDEHTRALEELAKLNLGNANAKSVQKPYPEKFKPDEPDEDDEEENKTQHFRHYND